MTDSLDLDNFLGRNLSYSSEKLKNYKQLLDDPLSPFKDKTMADIFVYATIYGFINNCREELKNIKPQISSLALSKQHRAILLTIAISHKKNIDILFEPSKAIKIIEEYANGGIGKLESELLGNFTVDVITQLSSNMLEIIDEQIKSTQHD